MSTDSNTRREQGSRVLKVVSRFTLLLICVIGSAASWGNPIRFDRISRDDGLSQSTVLTIFQDSRGFVWVGTEDGLNRYNGYTFTVYKHDPTDPASLPDNIIWAIDEDDNGDLWIGTGGGGIVRWDFKTDVFHRVSLNLDDDVQARGCNVRALHISRNNNVWVGLRNADKGLVRIDTSTGIVTGFSHEPTDSASLSSNEVYAIVEDYADNLWIGTDDGLNRLDPATGRCVRYVNDPSRTDSLSDNKVRSLLEDNGEIWVGTYSGGLNRLDLVNGSFVRYLHDPEEPSSLTHNRVRTILKDGSGRIWIGTSNGLNLLQPQVGTFMPYLNDPLNPMSLSDNHIISIFEDQGGVLWIGTRTGGINKWNPATWSFGHVGAASMETRGVEVNNVTSFAEDPEGHIWIGSFGGGLIYRDRTTGATTQYRHDPQDAGSLSSDRVMALQWDRSGRLWIGTLDCGLNCFDPATGAFSKFRHDPTRPTSLGADGIMCLFEDSSGELWIGTFGGGLNRFDSAKNSFTRFTTDLSNPNSLSADRVTCLIEDRSGNLWIGTDGGGLNVFNRDTENFSRFLYAAGDPVSLSSDTVFSLHVDDAATLWVGTRGSGLCKLERFDASEQTAVFRNISERDGLPNDVIYGIQSDTARRLWLSTNNGLARLNPRTGDIKCYGVAHGLQSNEFNFGASYQDSAGMLYFGGIAGYNAFKPDQLKKNLHLPPVVLTSYLKFNKPVPLENPVSLLESVDLGFKDDMVTFEFAALDYATPEDNRYACKLEGFDHEWIELGSIRRQTYTNLDPGEYVFRVRAANNDGIWNEEGTSLAITVLPPPWQTWWAYSLYTLIFSAVLFGFFWAQRKKLLREEGYSRKLEVEVEERTEELAERNKQLEALNGKLRDASLSDALTGLRNRRFFFEQVEQEVSVVGRQYSQAVQADVRIYDADLLLMMIDIDFFKEVNDRFGHDAGDRVLLAFKDVMKQTCRGSDVLIRWGGDEFLVLGRGSDPMQAHKLAERLCRRIAKQSVALENGKTVNVTCSIGYACFPFEHSQPERHTWENVLHLADTALYVAKKTSRNAWVGFLNEMPSFDSDNIRKVEIPSRLHPEGAIQGVISSIPKGVDLVWPADVTVGEVDQQQQVPCA